MISIPDLLSRISVIANDEEFIRWSKSELLMWINDAASEIVVRKPAAGSKTTTLTLVGGVLQTLPERTHMLLDIVRNVNGKRITVADRHRLEDSAPNWYDMTANATRHYCYEDRNPQSFYVYPPATEGQQVEAVIAAIPAKVEDVSGQLDLGIEYMGVIVSYALYRLLSKDSEEANASIAIAHYQAFSEALGSGTAAQLDSSPNKAKP